MSGELVAVAKASVALPVAGTIGGAGVLIAAATGQVELVENWGPYGLLGLLLVWMTQQLSKKLDAMLDSLNATRVEITALRAEIRETRTTLERQELRLEAVETIVRSCDGRGTA